MAHESGEVEGVDGCGGEESWPPWVLVSPEDVAGLLAAYREACRAGSVRAAVGFVAVLARPRDGWHAAVRVLVALELAVALDATDSGSLPDADPTGAPEVRSLAEGSAMVAVPLSGGRTVVVTVVTVVASGGAWLVNDVEPDIGN